jgi:hypothetical protein
MHKKAEGGIERSRNRRGCGSRRSSMLQRRLFKRPSLIEASIGFQNLLANVISGEPSLKNYNRK